jgi:hypothetical protein
VIRARLRQPLFWILAAEVVVMFALLTVSWRIYEAHRSTPAASLPALGTATPTAPAEPGASVAGPLPTPTGGRPPLGPRPPSGFPVQLGQINAQQASLERVEDAVLARLVEAMRGYLETVVLPAVRRAESDTAATTPAIAQSPAAIRKMP